METNEVHTAFEAFEKADETVSMALVVVETGEHGIFETYTALASEVIFLDKVEHVFFAPCFLDRHDAGALLREWVVEADCEMALALVEIATEVRKDTDGRDCDALWAPAESPIGGQHGDGAHDVVVVVERLAHAHEHGIGQLL